VAVWFSSLSLLFYVSVFLNCVYTYVTMYVCSVTQMQNTLNQTLNVASLTSNKVLRISLFSTQVRNFVLTQLYPEIRRVGRWSRFNFLKSSHLWASTQVDWVDWEKLKSSQPIKGDSLDFSNFTLVVFLHLPYFVSSWL